MLLFMALLGCDPTIMDVSGSVGGNYSHPCLPTTVVHCFFNIELIAKMYWLEKIYRNGEAPHNRNLEALQLTSMILMW